LYKILQGYNDLPTENDLKNSNLSNREDIINFFSGSNYSFSKIEMAKIIKATVYILSMFNIRIFTDNPTVFIPQKKSYYTDLNKKVPVFKKNFMTFHYINLAKKYIVARDIADFNIGSGGRAWLSQLQEEKYVRAIQEKRVPEFFNKNIKDKVNNIPIETDYRGDFHKIGNSKEIEFISSELGGNTIKQAYMSHFYIKPVTEWRNSDKFNNLNTAVNFIKAKKDNFKPAFIRDKERKKNGKQKVGNELRAKALRNSDNNYEFNAPVSTIKNVKKYNKALPESIKQIFKEQGKEISKEEIENYTNLFKVHRVFQKDKDNGGRYYSKYVSTKRDLRKGMNEALGLVETDIPSCAVNILYYMNNNRFFEQDYSEGVHNYKQFDNLRSLDKVGKKDLYFPIVKSFMWMNRHPEYYKPLREFVKMTMVKAIGAGKKLKGKKIEGKLSDKKIMSLIRYSLAEKGLNYGQSKEDRIFNKIAESYNKDNNTNVYTGKYLRSEYEKAKKRNEDVAWIQEDYDRIEKNIDWSKSNNWEKFLLDLNYSKKERNKLKIPPIITAEEVFVYIHTYYDSFKNFLWAGVSGITENIESNMNEKLLNYCVENNIPAFPIHDAIYTLEKDKDIVEKKQWQFLEEAIIDRREIMLTKEFFKTYKKKLDDWQKEKNYPVINIKQIRMKDITTMDSKFKNPIVDLFLEKQTKKINFFLKNLPFETNIKHSKFFLDSIDNNNKFFNIIFNKFKPNKTKIKNIKPNQLGVCWEPEKKLDREYGRFRGYEGYY